MYREVVLAREKGAAAKCAFLSVESKFDFQKNVDLSTSFQGDFFFERSFMIQPTEYRRCSGVIEDADPGFVN